MELMTKYLMTPTINAVKPEIFKLNAAIIASDVTASKIAITRAMGISDITEWNMDSIMKRDIRISDEIIKILSRWNKEYLNVSAEASKADEPSEEDLARIEEFKRKGWI